MIVELEQARRVLTAMPLPPDPSLGEFGYRMGVKNWEIWKDQMMRVLRELERALCEDPRYADFVPKVHGLANMLWTVGYVASQEWRVELASVLDAIHARTIVGVE